MGFKSIQIKNFRSIRKLHIQDMKQVNLITGRNNSGKSTLLEAMFLSSGMTNPQLALNIHNFRGLGLTQDEDFLFLFHALSEKETPEIISYIDRKKRTLKINLHRSGNGFPKSSQNGIIKNKQFGEELEINPSTNLIEHPPISGVSFDAESNGKRFHSHFSFSDQEMAVDQNYIEKLKASIITPSTIMSSFPPRLNNLIVNKNMGGIISTLKKIEPNLTDIQMGAIGQVYADIGLDKLVPINIMGDGIRRILSILTFIYESRERILFIDEIENGLHYSSIGVLWEAVKDAADKNDVQIFAVTHSQDCVAGFVKTFDEQDSVSLIKLERSGEEHIVKTAGQKTLKIALERDFEVR